MRISSLALIFVATQCVVAAQSQPPTPAPPIGRQQPQQKPAAQNRSADTPNPVSIANVADAGAPSNQTQGTQPAQTASPQNNQPPPDWWMRIESLDPNWVIAFLTFVLSGLAIAQVIAAFATNRHTRVVERAYVTMSHRPPGIAAIEITGKVSMSIRVDNHGNTPATITGVRMRVLAIPNGESLPERPDYGHTEPHDTIRTLLVSNEKFFKKGEWPIEATPPFKIGQDATHTIYVIGYVDYIDKFGYRHRAGYARMHDASIDALDRYKKPGGGLDEERFASRNNLVFVTQPRYNYDRKRKKGEGNDWDEPTE